MRLMFVMGEAGSAWTILSLYWWSMNKPDPNIGSAALSYLN